MIVSRGQGRRVTDSHTSEIMMLYFCSRLSRFEKTNEMLINFNMLSSSRFETTSQEFKRHTMLLYDMKKDLDVVFRRIRSELNHVIAIIVILKTC